MKTVGNRLWLLELEFSLAWLQLELQDHSWISVHYLGFSPERKVWQKEQEGWEVWRSLIRSNPLKETFLPTLFFSLPCLHWFLILRSLQPLIPSRLSIDYLMALSTAGTARYGTVRFTFGGFPLGTVPGTWYFFSTTSVEVPSSRTVTKTWRVNLCWSLNGRRKSSLLRPTELRHETPSTALPLDLNQHSQRRIGRNFCLNKRTFLHQPQNSSVVVCWGSSDVPLVDSRGRGSSESLMARRRRKSLMYNVTLNLLYFQSMFSVYIFTSVSVFCFN